ncbi:MAG: PP2C family protein-serine/threonine phosphatase [Phycisphaeraceae bacterium]|nr:PP2C family protein-serine/threonine phosphatase [Phycisphaeraceae bacterium]
MTAPRRHWTEELDIIDRLMRSVSDLTDPEEMVSIYWNGVHDLFPIEDFLAISRRGVEPPGYLVTRSSRFEEHLNPWKQRHRLPRLEGGLLGEIAYANRPIVIDDLPDRLTPDDPGHFFLQGFQSLIALPNYENGQSLNVGMMLFKPGVEYDRAMVPMMHWQSSLFGRGTQNLVLRNQLTDALAALDRELQTVAQIQRSLLPVELPSIPGFEIATSYETSARAGGDYYDFFPLGERGWGVFIADVSGHGTPAAVLMAVTHAIAHTRPGSAQPPCEVLAHINHHLAKSYTTSGTFVTAFYAAIDPQTRLVSYSNAGHNPPRLVRGDRVIALDENASIPLGIMPDASFQDGTVALQRGDVLVMYTDGITESMAPTDAAGSRSLFGENRLDRLLIESRHRTAAEIAESIVNTTRAFSRGEPATDDRTLIVMRVIE